MARKILYSPGYGAGWSTWQYEIPTEFSCTYPPIIAALEQGEKLTETHPAIIQYLKDCKEKFNLDYVCVLGVVGLTVREIDDEEGYQIHEYDGNESIELRSEQKWN